MGVAGAAAGFTDLIGRGLCKGFVDVQAGDMSPVCGASQSHRFADPGTGPDHDRVLFVQPKKLVHSAHGLRGRTCAVHRVPMMVPLFIFVQTPPRRLC